MKKFTQIQYQAFIDVAQDDTQLLEDIKAERATLVRELATDPEVGKEVINGSGNGTSFAASITMTKHERLEFLQTIIQTIDSGIPPQSSSIARFF